MPPMPTPTALGTMAPFIGITLPIVQPFLGWASGIAATFAPIDTAARRKVECWQDRLPDQLDWGHTAATTWASARSSG
jgi:hypothetical protein